MGNRYCKSPPGHIISYRRQKKPDARYLRYGREDGLEPILIQRHFHGIKQAFFDVSEEFRHLYNLYYDGNEKKYIIILDDGNEEDVIRINDESIKINAKYLKEFLAVKNANLVLYYNIDRFSSGKFSESAMILFVTLNKQNLLLVKLVFLMMSVNTMIPLFLADYWVKR